MKHAEYLVDPHSVDEEKLLRMIGSIHKGGNLDVVVWPPPSTVEEADAIMRKLYAYAPSRPKDLDYNVVFREPGNDATVLTEKSGFINKYESVAVGGTFDHLHWGHKLLLSMTAYTASERVVVGVTGSELLVNKKYAEALDTYDMRVENVRKFIDYLRPGIPVDIYELRDMYGPTATVRELDALVVSEETKDGGGKVNQKRAELGFPALDIVQVGLITSEVSDKLSSTELRKEDLESRM